MCLAIPMKLEKIKGNVGLAEYKGVKYQVQTDLLENVREGDYVIVHAGFAIQTLDEEEAAETLKIFEELDELYGEVP